MRWIFSWDYFKDQIHKFNSQSLEKIATYPVNGEDYISGTTVLSPDATSILIKCDSGYTFREIVGNDKIVEKQTIHLKGGKQQFSPDGQYIAIRAGHTAYIYNADEFLSHAKGAEQY
jgi:hypothetical protein